MGSKSSFDSILAQAIDEALLSLGEAPKTAIYHYLEKECGILKQEIPERIEDLSDALEKIFGLGARNLEILFMKYLHAKIGCATEWNASEWIIPDLTFKEYVELMKKTFEKPSKNEEEMVGLLALIVIFSVIFYIIQKIKS